jgi:hypothetical protein
MLLWMLLGAGPPADTVVDVDSAAVGVVEPVFEDAYAKSLAAVERAVVVASSDPHAGFDQLSAALPEVMGHMPLLAVDPAAKRVVLEGELALARAALVCDEPTAALASMSRVLFMLSMDGRLHDFSVERFGPRIAELYERRLTAIEAGDSGRVLVECTDASQVYIDGRQVARTLVCSRGVTLGVGEHWVWIAGEEQADGPLFHDLVVIAESGSVTRIVAPSPPPTPPPPAPTLVDGPASAPFEPEPAGALRLAPRWTEVSMIALSLGQGAIAASLLSTSPCEPGAQTSGRCPAVDPRDVGVAVATLGACLLVTSAVLLAVDEHRQKTRRRSR